MLTTKAFENQSKNSSLHSNFVYFVYSAKLFYFADIHIYNILTLYSYFIHNSMVIFYYQINYNVVFSLHIDKFFHNSLGIFSKNISGHSSFYRLFYKSTKNYHKENLRCFDYGQEPLRTTIYFKILSSVTTALKRARIRYLTRSRRFAMRLTSANQSGWILILRISKNMIKPRFFSDNFVEDIDFDYLEIHVIEED